MAGRLDAWSLTLEGPFEPASVAYVARVRRASGEAAVLKVNAPDPESEGEAQALRWWAGEGSVRVLEDDEATGALLLERCEPGDRLWSLPEADALPIAASVVRALHRRPPPPGHAFRLLETEASRWAAELPRRWERHGRPFEPPLLDSAMTAIDRLIGAPAPSVLLHQDLHGGNILRRRSLDASADGRVEWVAIDPKPVVGDPAFDLASLLRDRRPELADDRDAARRVRHRLDLLSELLGYDRERIRDWGIVHALAWGIDDETVLEMHVRCARWLLEA